MADGTLALGSFPKQIKVFLPNTCVAIHGSLNKTKWLDFYNLLMKVTAVKA
jgi:hypothetical protein